MSLARLKQFFPNKFALHQRIDTLLKPTSVLRVGIIPHVSSRQHIKPVLETLIADPVGDSEWFPYLQDRSLTKDVHVFQADSFNYIQTRNYSLEFPLPLEGLPVELFEASDIQNSADHLGKCHILVFCTKDPQTALKTPIESHYPRLLVIDKKQLVQTPPKVLQYTADEFYVDTSAALAANELLRQSPTKITSYIDSMASSNIQELKKAVFDADRIKDALYNSVLYTCRSILEEEKAAVASRSCSAQQISEWRREWSKQAHAELHSSLCPEIEKSLFLDLAWYRLYFKADDVYGILESCLRTCYLPQARARLDYVIGRIDQATPGGVPGEVSEKSLKRNDAEELDRAQFATLSEATKLHNSALNNILMSALGIQAPLMALGWAGWYFLGLSGNTMLAVGILGLVVGFRQLQVRWLSLCEGFSEQVFKSARDAINKTESHLASLYEDRVLNQSKAIIAQEKCLEQINSDCQGQSTLTKNDARRP